MNNKVLEQLIQENPSLIVDNQRVKCSLSGHEMPVSLSAVQEYVHGSKYRRLKSIRDAFEENKDYLQDVGDTYYCKVTHRYISKDAGAIHRHLCGNRFKRNLQKAQTEAIDANADEVMSDDGSESDDEPFSEEDSGTENGTHEYPELLGSVISDSEDEMNAMDTEIDQRATNKRPARKRTLADSPENKRKRQ